MPFDKYLQDANTNDNPIGNSNGNGILPYSHAIEFQIPQFIYAGAPTLAPGGGAEVLSFNPSGSLASAWFNNNGFNTLSNASFTKPVTTPFEFDAFPSPPISIEHPFPFLQPVSAATAAATAITAPSALGLPVYSASGFDLLSILARVATRPSPRVALGPVDLTCSFVVVDVRRHDHPIVYCSPSFCRLTGYPENEVLGRNCRFLQAPPSVGVRRGDERVYTDGERVKNMRKMLAADKECQISIVNYRRDASAFCNLVTVIPIGGGEVGEGGENEVVYHVGFQVDLGEQPNLILQKLKEGSYAGVGLVQPIQQQITLTRDSSVSAAANAKKGLVIPPIVMSKTLKKLLNNPKFIASFPVSTSTNVPTPLPASTSAAHENNPLSLILLEYSPDFVHVVSLKGAFLYVAPSVRRVLGWEPEDLVGKSVTDLAHPEDVVPLMRELKEGSAASVGAGSGDKAPGDTLSGSETKGSEGAVISGPRTVDMLYRARTKGGRYVWVESRGKLHVEPGKGRKAIVLSGRAKEMGRVLWGAIAERGMCKPAYVPASARKQNGKAEKLLADKGKGKEKEGGVRVVKREFWAMASGSGSASFLSVGGGVTDVLGWEAEELIGRRVSALVVDLDGNVDGEAGRVLQRGGVKDGVSEVRCAMARKDGGVAEVSVVFYPSTSTQGKDEVEKLSISPPPILVQVKVVDPSTAAAAFSLASASIMASGSGGVISTSTLVHPPDANIFEELETARGTSWQYELEKLRYANVRLEQEIERLEAMAGAGGEDAAGVRVDSAVDVAENDKGDTQSHSRSDLDGRSSRELQPIAQQERELYEQQYQLQPQPQYHEQQPQHILQETQGSSRYTYPQPQRQQSQSYLHLSQAHAPQLQQPQGMYATTPLQVPAPQTMTLPSLLHHQNQIGYKHHYHSQYYEYEEHDQEHQRKRMRQAQSQSQVHISALEAQMLIAPVVEYPLVPPAPQPQPLVSMQDWVQQQRQYVPQPRGVKRPWTGHES